MASEQPIDFRQGTGEDTTLETATVDVVVCAQSFHWFDAAAALNEFHRILRRSPGRLALMWNVRDDDDAFTAEYGEVCKRAQHDARNDGTIVRQDHHGDPTIGGWFDHVTKESFSNAQFMDLAGILGRVRSASYFPKAGPLRTELEALLQRSFDRHQRDGKIALRYRAEFTTAIRIDA